VANPLRWIGLALLAAAPLAGMGNYPLHLLIMTLLWAFVYTGWAIMGRLGLVSLGFHLFLLLTSNPFERLIPMPADGRDLNPLLQDPGMIIHPPMLYMGYVGFSVVFAFAIAALLGGKLDAPETGRPQPEPVDGIERRSDQVAFDITV